MEFENKIKTAIIPAAGKGTRLYPITKTQPKEMLPIYDKPIIQIVVEEAIDSGIETIIIITSKNKPTMENHFDIVETENPALKNLNEKLKKVDIIFKRQNQQKGLGHAILCAKNLVHEEKFAVLLGDDFYIKNKVPALKQLINHLGDGDGILSSEIRSKEDMSSKGMIVEKDGLILDLIEKPSSDEVNSKYAISGRYILPKTIFEKLEKLEPSKRGEIELTDGIKECLISGNKIKHKIIDGWRLDVGTPEEYLNANIEYAKYKNLI